jgi:outer membrane protein assembly factor BamD (BamD/ComL family)
MIKKKTILTLLFTVAILFTFANFNFVSAQEFNIFVNSNECLDLENNSLRDSVRLKVAPCDNNSATQKFQIVEKPGTVYVNIKVSSNRCLEILRSNTRNGIDVTQFNCDNSSEQAFRMPSGFDPSRKGAPSVSGEISFSHSGKCFDTQNRPWVQQFPCNRSQSQRFEIKEVPTLSKDAKFLNDWAARLKALLPLPIVDVTLERVTSYCPFGCTRTSSTSYLSISSSTPKLTRSSVSMNQLERSLRPTLEAQYCSSGAAQRSLNLEVLIEDMNRNFIGDFVVRPNDCNVGINPTPTPTTPGNSGVEEQYWDAVKSSSDAKDFQSYLNTYPTGKYAPLARLRIRQFGGTTPTPTPTPINTGIGSVEDQYWNNVKSSNNWQDFQSYINRYGQSGKYAPIANLRIRQLKNNTGPNPTPTPIISGGGSVEDQFWNNVKSSNNWQDFQSYINRYGQNGKYSAIADLRIRQLKGSSNPNTSTAEDQFWDNIKNSTQQQDFQDYLRIYPNGKYKALANLKIRQNPTPQQREDQFWDSIKTSNNLADFQNYMTQFPNGKYRRPAFFAQNRLAQERATADFLRNSQFGSLNEISNLRKVFVTATDANSRDRIIQDLQKKIPSLVFVNNRQSADFFIEYKLTIGSNCDPGTSTAINACELHSGRMWVHTLGLRGTGNEFNRILWTTTKSKAYSDQGVNFFTKNPAAQAASDLIKELRNLGF